MNSKELLDRLIKEAKSELTERMVFSLLQSLGHGLNPVAITNTALFIGLCDLMIIVEEEAALVILRDKEFIKLRLYLEDVEWINTTKGKPE